MMEDVVRQAIAFALSPSNALIAAASLALLLGLRRLALALCALLAFAAFGPASDALISPLETRFARPAPPPERVDGMLVLGGGLDIDRSAHWDEPAFGEAGDRVLAAAAAARRWPEATIVVTGGGSTGDEARWMARALEVAGIAPDRLVLETRSRSTRENATLSRATLEPRPGETWLLITSAAHIPRAMGSFAALCWPTIAWPTDYRSLGRLDWRLTSRDASNRLIELDAAAHEWIGLLYYRLRGWTPSLFPSPDASLPPDCGEAG